MLGFMTYMTFIKSVSKRVHIYVVTRGNHITIRKHSVLTTACTLLASANTAGVYIVHGKYLELRTKYLQHFIELGKDGTDDKMFRTCNV